MKLKFFMHCLTMMLEINTDVKIVEGEVNEITTIKHILRNCFISFFSRGMSCVLLS